MKKYLFYISIVLVFLGCKKEEVVKRPENLISEELMEDVLFDIYFISATKGYNMTSIKELPMLPEAYILNKYQIDSVSFAQSNIYYSSKPEKYAEVFSRVEKRFVSLKDSISTSMKANKKERDSISKNRKNASIKLDSAAARKKKPETVRQ